MTEYRFENVYDLLDAMEEQVKKFVELYKEDFYKYDVECITKSDENEEFEFVWLVRDTGTWMVHPKNLHSLFSFLSQTPHEVYLVGKGRGVYTLTHYARFGIA